MRKSLLIALTVILLAGALPATAQVAGTWAGEGSGSCYPPSGIVIHPWQTWKGEIPNTEQTFTGRWRDEDGNHGSFFGRLAPFSTPETVIYQGYWTLETPAGISKGGEFTMTFYFLEGECKGAWTSIWPSPGLPGKMWGKKVD
ncbi:hypothetical protein JXM67_07585 [candidate division WOR-3 bacterium]|nr:hypothetical protein [candidate division WOR-3 bacterium]